MTARPSRAARRQALKQAPTLELSPALVSVLEELGKIDRDDWHRPGDMGHAGVCLGHWASHTERALFLNRAQCIDAATYQLVQAPQLYPAEAPEAWRPQNPRRDLARAAAFIIAELERMDERLGFGADPAKAN